MIQMQNFIEGHYHLSHSGEMLPVFNPSTGEIFAQLPDSDARDVSRAVLAAARAFESWSRRSVEDRATILERIADLIDKNRDRLAEAESLDQGKPVSLASSMDIPRVSHNFRFFAGLIRHHSEQSWMEPGESINFTTRKPVGIAGLISPWNLPLYLLTWKIAPAIAVGNTVVCKPSEMTSYTAFLLGEILNEAGLPPGVVNIVLGLGAKAGAALVAHPEVPLISFTGGTATGQAISSVAAPLLKRMSLELGGKNPNIIFADCDLEKALATSLRSSFLNQGEICLCGSRIFVERSLYDSFVEKFVAATRELKVGDPKSKDTFMGPLVSQDHLEKVLSYIELALEEGGKIECGGAPPEFSGEEAERFAQGYWLTPTVITGLDSECRVMQEEIFGPVVTISPFDSEEDVIAAANGVKYGLSASVWTKNLDRAHRVAQALDCGTVWINTWMQRDLRVPFGGAKASGLGREGGHHSLEFFTETKNICVRLS